MSIRFMKFQSSPGFGPLFMVGTDPAAMRSTARHIDPAADDGVEINSEHVVEAIQASPEDAKRRTAILEDGVRAARSGTADYYLFG